MSTVQADQGQRRVPARLVQSRGRTLPVWPVESGAVVCRLLRDAGFTRDGADAYESTRARTGAQRQSSSLTGRSRVSSPPASCALHARRPRGVGASHGGPQIAGGGVRVDNR